MCGSWVPPGCRSVKLELRACDVAHAAVSLHGIVAKVHVVDGEQLAGRRLDDARIAQVPASAVVAQHELAPPRPTAVFADARTDSRRREAVAVHADQASVAHL